MTSAPCPNCGADFRCGIDDAAGCWCARLPAVPEAALQPGGACRCERCLRTRLSLPAREVSA